ncbi:hypothetical protein Ct9H90mP29_03840 [bacterium]|nr:MAG: hypothetical protein Ct9H90mP29_03840 [bacterium]
MRNNQNEILTLLLSASLLIAIIQMLIKSPAALKAGLFKEALEHISIAQEGETKKR